MEQMKMDAMIRRVALIKEQAEALAAESDSFPAVWRNALRIQACIKMLELNLPIIEGGE